MNLFSLAWRNSVRSFPRRWPVVLILAASVGVLEVGNTLFETSTQGLERTYVKSLASEWTVSAKSEEGFTIFGNELPLIGEYQVLPLLPNAEGWIDKVKAEGAQALGQVTAGGVLSSGNWTKAVPVFGVDFEGYFRFFPDLTVVHGALPKADTPSLVMNEVQYADVTQTLGVAPAMGTPFLLTVFNDHSFTIREVHLAAVYRYPVRDDALDRIALVDPDTARALNGYIYGAETSNTQALGTSPEELGALFDSGEDLAGPVGQGITENSVAETLADSSARKSLNSTIEGSWNFVLTHPAVGQEGRLRSVLGNDDSVQIRAWRDTVGGNALVVWILQLLFNAGLGFVTAAAALVGINGLALSVAERTQELGTLRALGASRKRVAGLVIVESLFLVAGAGFIGVALGSGVIAWLGETGLVLPTPYLQALFGAEMAHPRVSMTQILLASLFSLGLGLVAVIIPVRRALAITPVAAMARE